MKPLKIAVILREFFKRLRLLYLVMHQAVILALDLEIDISVIFILNITQAWSLFVELSWLLSCRSKRGTRLLSLASLAACAGLVPRHQLESYSFWQLFFLIFFRG